MLPSYRNQSVDLLGRPLDWFLYDRNIGYQKVKKISFSGSDFQMKVLVSYHLCFICFHSLYDLLMI